MRLRNITGSREVIADSEFVVKEAVLFDCPGTWHDIFGNENPIHIEIGMGNMSSAKSSVCCAGLRAKRSRIFNRLEYKISEINFYLERLENILVHFACFAFQNEYNVCYIPKPVWATCLRPQ